MDPVVDLRSDTLTRPTPAMRRAMAEAQVGDDVFGEDPTVNRLQAMAAERLGMEAALFVPSGTMANEIAIRCQTRPGERVMCDSLSHIHLYECGGPAVISGVVLGLVPARRGILDPAEVEAALWPDDVHMAQATLLEVENTSNRGGGSVYPLAVLDGLVSLARRRGLRLHMDGARLFNAAVAQGVSVARICQGFDSACFCLSKGLGAPVGSVLCGSRDFIRDALRARKLLGGGMRQVGILAAAGIHALEHHVDRLADDHARAHRLARGLNDLGFQAEMPETNMVYARVPQAARVVQGLAEEGVLALSLSDDRVRLVTHLDVDDGGIQRTLAAFEAWAR